MKFLWYVFNSQIKGYAILKIHYFLRLYNCIFPNSYLCIYIHILWVVEFFNIYQRLLPESRIVHIMKKIHYSTHTLSRMKVRPGLSDNLI